jgi:hypothetical protein
MIKSVKYTESVLSEKTFKIEEWKYPKFPHCSYAEINIEDFFVIKLFLFRKSNWKRVVFQYFPNLTSSFVKNFLLEVNFDSMMNMNQIKPYKHCMKLYMCMLKNSSVQSLMKYMRLPQDNICHCYIFDQALQHYMFRPLYTSKNYFKIKKINQFSKWSKAKLSILVKNLYSQYIGCRMSMKEQTLKNSL